MNPNEPEQDEPIERPGRTGWSPAVQAILCFFWTWIAIFVGTVAIGSFINTWEALGNLIAIQMGIAAVIAVLLLIFKHPWKALGIFIALASPFLLALVCWIGNG